MTRPSLLLITADDMNWDSVGCYGYPVGDITPNIDSLAQDGIRFTHGHVTIAVCQPSRSAIMTGRYPHRNGGEGFHTLRHEGIPILPELLRDAGYIVGILGKVGHSTPYPDFAWDICYDQHELGHGRAPEIYREHAVGFMEAAVETDQPFFLMANSHDPHRPFYGNDRDDWYEDGKQPKSAVPSRTYRPEDISIPGFLPELDDVRLEISEYCSSVRRCDDTVGGILQALERSGAADNTLVLFLSDNGMAFPFAKTNCYLNSTQTPWLMRWPGHIAAGLVDTEHFVSGIDILPTFLDAAGVGVPAGIDGASFLPLLSRERQDNRDLVFTEFHQTAGRRNYPMRCVQNARYGYIFNPWSDGERIFRNESQSGRTFEAMKAVAECDSQIADRVDLFLHRVPEEFYDFAHDPNALSNRIDDPACAAERKTLQDALEQRMIATGDPLLESFRHRDDPGAREQAVRDLTAVLGGE